jgi:hypothetical protein
VRTPRASTPGSAPLTSARHRLATGVSATPEERALYEDACLYFLRITHDASLQELVAPGSPSPQRRRLANKIVVRSQG